MATTKVRQRNGTWIKVMSHTHVEKLKEEPKYPQNRHARRTLKALERGKPEADKKWRHEQMVLEQNKLRRDNLRKRIEKRQNAKRTK